MILCKEEKKKSKGKKEMLAAAGLSANPHV